MVPIIGSYATSGKYAYKASDIMRHMGTNYTKSNIKLGNKVHSHYKILETDGKNLLKEYSIRGGRVDFINKETHTIYELKPYNPNNVRRGIKQLEPVGPNGEIIIDYSVHDAIAAGFKKIIFIIDFY